MSDKPKKPKPVPTTYIRKHGTVAYSYGPARGYSWQQFRAGNMANLRHGAYSERVVSMLADEIRPEVLEAPTQMYRRLESETKPD
ncbi:MAG: hypothetical protein WCF24_09575 [Acidimicrobiales bacterium]